jgi:hypothetical protein
MGKCDKKVIQKYLCEYVQLGNTVFSDVASFLEQKYHPTIKVCIDCGLKNKFTCLQSGKSHSGIVPGVIAKASSKILKPLSS